MLIFDLDEKSRRRLGVNGPVEMGIGELGSVKWIFCDSFIGACTFSIYLFLYVFISMVCET